MTIPDFDNSPLERRIRAAAHADPEPDVSAYAGGEGGCGMAVFVVGLFGAACVAGIVAALAWWAGGAW